MGSGDTENGNGQKGFLDHWCHSLCFQALDQRTSFFREIDWRMYEVRICVCVCVGVCVFVFVCVSLCLCVCVFLFSMFFLFVLCI